MIKIEFSEDTSKMDWDEFYALYLDKLKTVSPELYNQNKTEGCLSVMRLTACIVFPVDAEKFDRNFLTFPAESVSKNVMLWFPAHIPDMKYNRFAYSIAGCRIYTPKGTDTEAFFKSFHFPKSVENGYPVIEGKKIIPNNSTMLFFDTEGTKKDNKNEEIGKTTFWKKFSWKKMLSAIAGFIIALLIFLLVAQGL